MKTSSRLLTSIPAIAALICGSVTLLPDIAQASIATTLSWSINNGATYAISSPSTAFNPTTLSCSDTSCTGATVADFNNISMQGYVIGTGGIDLGVDYTNAADFSGTNQVTATYGATGLTSQDLLGFLTTFTGHYAGASYINMVADVVVNNVLTQIGTFTIGSMTSSTTHTGAINYNNLFNGLLPASISPYELLLTSTVWITGNNSNFISSDNSAYPVPEPSELGMMGLGLMIIGLMGLKSRQKKYHSKSLEA